MCIFLLKTGFEKKRIILRIKAFHKMQLFPHIRKYSEIPKLLRSVVFTENVINHEQNNKTKYKKVKI